MVSRRGTRVVLLGVGAVFLGLQVLWVGGSWYPSGYDEITHLHNAREVALQVRD